MEQLNADELLQILQNSFNKEESGGINTAIQLNLGGTGGGQWYLQIKNRNMEVKQGFLEEADAEINVAANDLLMLISGSLDPLKAYFTGKVKISGDQSAVIKLLSLFNISNDDMQKLRGNT
jgi:putative sterol carrier protein